MGERRHAAVLLAAALLALSTAAAMGAGRCRTPDGAAARWTGACRAGFAEGSGTLEWGDGRTYTGTLRRGRPNGQGVQVWPNGTRYSGGWRDGVREGFGTLHMPDGRRYVGRFAHDRPTGEGEFLSPMGTRYRARVRPDGTIVPGRMLGDTDSPARDPPAQTAARPDSLEEWLRGP